MPDGANVLLLKSILHNWRDDKAKVILANCRKAMNQGAKMLLFERIMPEVVEENPVHQARVTSDLNMLVGLSGRERTQRELSELLKEVGLRWNNEVELTREFSMVEIVIA